MKKTITTAFLLMTLSAAFAQKDSTHKKNTDSTITASSKQDSVTVKNYAIILNEQEFGSLVAILKSADEKPSIIDAWINFLSTRSQLLLPQIPEKAKPKK